MRRFGATVFSDPAPNASGPDGTPTYYPPSTPEANFTDVNGNSVYVAPPTTPAASASGSGLPNWAVPVIGVGVGVLLLYIVSSGHTPFKGYRRSRR